MNKMEILSVLKELHMITGFRISLRDSELREIVAYPEWRLPFCAGVAMRREERERCLECDREACRRALLTKSTYKYRCRFGLTEAVSPIYNFNILTGYLIMGQILEEGDSPTCAALNGLPLPVERIPRVPRGMVDSYVNIMTICARYLTMSNAVESPTPTTALRAKRYILDNLASKLSLTEICNSIGCSKSTLLTTFKRTYGTTVNGFITDARLNMAKRMLMEGHLTINEIALESGFYDQSYFSKVFSRKHGITPSAFRASAQYKRETEIGDLSI